MIFDVRLPIGLLFLALGLLIGGYGLIGEGALLEAQWAGLNIDVVWGAVMAVFGGLMLLLTAASRGKAPPAED